MTQFIGCYATDALVPGGYYRVGLKVSELWTLFDSGAKQRDLEYTYNNIRNVCALIPNMPFGAAPGATAFVVDCTAATNAAGQTCGSAASAIDGGFSSFTSCVTFEKLASPPSVNAPAERQTVAAAIENAPTALTSVGNALSGFGDDVKYMIITAAIIAAVVLLKDLTQEWT